MIKDIRRNFEFLYFARGRNICPNYEVLDKPFETLKKLGGVESLTIQTNGGDDVDEHMHRGFSFCVKVFKFPGHSIEAYCTREERPEHPKNPAYVTRVRLGNYNTRDDLSKEVSQALASLPTSD